MNNYSQNKEQEAILKYFGGFKGTFLDIGANDGATLSNTRALAELGWCGVLVEPAPIAYSKLKSLYESKKKCIYTYQCAIGDHNGKGTLFDSGSLFKTGDTSLVSTLVEAETERFKSVLSYSPVEVKVYKWKTFFNRLYLKQFDFISIDCEGFDAAILEQMEIGPEVKCICIEWNGHENLKQQFSKKLEGFKIIYTSAENLIFAR